jgi:ABC-type phosphate transport system substrate-binding protein
MERSCHNRCQRCSPAVVRGLALLGVVVLLSASRSEADGIELLVIVNSSNAESRLSQSELRALFLTKKRTWSNGETADPVNLPEKSPQRNEFDQRVLGFNAESAARYWVDRKVRGDARPPRKLPTPAAVQAYVAASPGGIGYVPPTTLAAGVKTVARIVGGEVVAP